MRRDEMLPIVNGTSAGGVHPSAVRAEGLSIFDSRPRGGFEVRILGYDRAQVEEHIRQLEQALAYTRAMNRQLDRQIAQLRQQFGERSRLRLSEPGPEHGAGGVGAPAAEDGASE